MMKKGILQVVDALFERDGIVQALVTAMMVLASEYWVLTFTPDELLAALAFTVLTPAAIALYIFWDTLEAGFEEYFLGETE